MKPRLSFLVVCALAMSCIDLSSCPSPPGGPCEPRSTSCPGGYHCALAEVCTRACAVDTECWVSIDAGCRSQYLPGQRLPDGGVYVESAPDGICPESRELTCQGGYCQLLRCADGGCDYDLYGPSPFKGGTPHGATP